jgi:hypothetical protein
MKQLTRTLAATVVALAVTAGAAQAQVTFSGTTTAAFNGAAFGAVGANTLGGLTIANGAFTTTTTTTGFGGIGGSGVNLGVASLTASPFTYQGNMLSLLVNFTAPVGTSSSTFMANLLGSVEVDPTRGGVSVVFAPSTLMGTFPTGNTYMLSIDNISLTPGQSNVEITGRITANVVPEPATVGLLGTGLLGLVGVSAARRRQKV